MWYTKNINFESCWFGLDIQTSCVASEFCWQEKLNSLQHPLIFCNDFASQRESQGRRKQNRQWTFLTGNVLQRSDHIFTSATSQITPPFIPSPCNNLASRRARAARANKILLIKHLISAWHSFNFIFYTSWVGLYSVVCLWVSEMSGIGVTRPNLHFFQYIQAYKHWLNTT